MNSVIHTRFSSFASRILVAAAMVAICAIVSSTAFSQEVTTQLSAAKTSVGQPVQLIVNVSGGRNPKVPEVINVNGLRVNLAGRRSSSSVQFGSGGFQSTTTTSYIYLVVPQFEGEFTIPPFDVSIDGKAFKTAPMRLSVEGTTTVPTTPTLPTVPMPVPPGATAGGTTRGEAAPYFADIVLSKRKAYFGEVVPAELRFYFHSRIGGQVGDHPNFGGEGFTVQKFSTPSKREQVVNGENYTVFTFQTSVTPVKTGKLEIPPAKLDARLQVPGGVPQGLAEMFGNMIPPGMFSDTRDITVETKSASIEVVPLPKEGRPDNFSGAIGKFTLDASVSPKKAGPGEPFTLHAIVAGQGNFDAFTAPALTGDDDWRSYPPTDKTSNADSIGFAAEKSFDYTLIARKDATQTPGLEFSYFDPSSGKYATLVSPPLPVEAKAGGAGSSTGAAQGNTAATQAPAASPTPDIAVMAAGSSNWRSVLQRRDFWIANIALAALWAAIAIIVAIRRHSSSEAGRRAATRRAARSILNNLKATAPDEFDARAMQFLCTTLECDALRLPETVARLPLSADDATAVQRILDRHAESQYAARPPSPPSPEERAAAVAALKNISSSTKR